MRSRHERKNKYATTISGNYTNVCTWWDIRNCISLFNIYDLQRSITMLTNILCFIAGIILGIAIAINYTNKEDTKEKEIKKVKKEISRLEKKIKKGEEKIIKSCGISGLEALRKKHKED